MVGKTQKEETRPPEEEEAGLRFSAPIDFEEAVDALLRVKPEPRGGRKKAPPESGADPSTQPED